MKHEMNMMLGDACGARADAGAAVRGRSYAANRLVGRRGVAKGLWRGSSVEHCVALAAPEVAPSAIID
jgi:hypothetical protein